MRKLVLAALVLLSGCRHSRNADDVDEETVKMRRWVGVNIHVAVSDMGPPTGIYQNGPTSIYEWTYTGSTRAVAFGGRFFAAGTGWTESCREWFDVDDHEIIIGWHWQGHC